jgi:ABC-type bacteriocin/lantibiotic exporter with double-glycine peptidase domain
MTVATAPIMLDSSKALNPFRGHGQLFFSSAIHASAPWQYTVFSRLHDLEKSKAKTPASKMHPVSQTAVMLARIVLADLRGVENIPTPSVCPTSGGEIGIVWSLGNKQLEVLFSDNQAGSFVLSQNDEIIEDGEVAPQSTARLQNAINSIVLA